MIVGSVGVVAPAPAPAPPAEEAPTAGVPADAAAAFYAVRLRRICKGRHATKKKRQRRAHRGEVVLVPLDINSWGCMYGRYTKYVCGTFRYQ